MTDNFLKKKVTVIGLARSGVGAALALKGAGAAVFGSDAGSPESERLLPLAKAGIPIEVGGHSARIYDADLFVVSPGVPLAVPALQSARSRNIPIIGEVELAYLLTRADIVAVTGSNGKSTTTALAGALFAHGPFRSRMGGNIGEALTAQLEGLGAGDVLVAELSSFQLDAIDRFRPRAAAILNLTPDHLDRYPSADHYYASKLGVTRNQIEGDLLVLNADDPVTRGKARDLKTRAQIAWFSLEKEVERGAFVRDGGIVSREAAGDVPVGRADEVGLIGAHNLMNVLAAVVLARHYKIEPGRIRETLKTFKGIEHRIEFVRTKNGVRFYNDSKGTNVDSVRWALLGFPGRIRLIAGGRDKASDFTLLSPLIRERVAGLYLIGEAASKMEKSWAGLAPVRMAGTLEAAVRAAFDESAEGDVVLLSPACASYDQYRNYEERGRHFKAVVGAL